MFTQAVGYRRRERKHAAILGALRDERISYSHHRPIHGEKELSMEAGESGSAKRKRAGTRLMLNGCEGLQATAMF